MEDLITVNHAAILLKVHPLTIRRYINEGKLKAIRVGGNIRISTNDLQAFSQIFSPHTKNVKSNQPESFHKAFSANDPFLRLRSRGLSLDKF